MDSVANREILSSAGEEAVTAAALFELPPAPEISPNSDAESGEPEALENGILATRLPPAPDPFVTATIDANQRPDRGNVLHKIFGGRHIRPDFVPARALHQVNPDVPEAMRRRLKNEVEVSVRLYLDSAGIVQYAELLSDGTGANRDLATLAVFSSRHWQFVPAHMGDAAVPAVVVVRFRFGRERDSGVSSTDGAM